MTVQVLRINLSSEQELTFLHTLEVGEDDFQTLKADQGILVDYGSFPGKLVSLLQKCIDSRDEKQPRWPLLPRTFRGLYACQMLRTQICSTSP